MASTSAIGNEYQTPFKPKNFGKIYTKGIKKIPCFNKVKNKAGKAFPAAWKYAEPISCAVITGVAKKVNIKAVGVCLIRAASVVKMRAIASGKIIIPIKISEATAVP